MSRLWNTPEYWARSEADEMLREMQDSEPDAIADSFERTAASYDGEPEMAAAIIAELRRRAAVGIRFWSGPQAIEIGRANAAPARLNGGTGGLPKPDMAELTDDDIPW